MLWKTSFEFIWDILNFLKICKSWVWAQIRRSKLLIWGCKYSNVYFTMFFFSDNPPSVQKCAIHFCIQATIENNKSSDIIIHTWLNKASQFTVYLNRDLSSLHGGLLEIAITVSLNTLSMQFSGKMKGQVLRLWCTLGLCIRWMF